MKIEGKANVLLSIMSKTFSVFDEERSVTGRGRNSFFHHLNSVFNKEERRVQHGNVG